MTPSMYSVITEAKHVLYSKEMSGDPVIAKICVFTSRIVSWTSIPFFHSSIHPINNCPGTVLGGRNEVMRQNYKYSLPVALTAYRETDVKHILTQIII